MADSIMLHGTCLSVDGEGVLLLGPSGAGKSDLALRLVDQPGLGIDGILRDARLVADDQVVITRRGGDLQASAPAMLKGKLEIRGLGIAALPAEDDVTLRLAVRLERSADIERLPDLTGSRLDILGLGLPLVQIDPFTASAPARVRAALDLFRRPQ
jgi:serine kinase of HPr protein (carbohydrate metabolism regulator)